VLQASTHLIRLDLITLQFVVKCESYEVPHCAALSNLPSLSPASKQGKVVPVLN
jgi:hypothetical protein